MAAARSYFYYLNERGHLFHVFDTKGLIEGTHIPSGPTYLRDRAFLDFFYLRLRHNSLTQFMSDNSTFENNSIITNGNNFNSKNISETGFVRIDGSFTLTPQEFQKHFPYVSLCGKEKNFLKVQDAPVVFTDYNFCRTPEDKLSGILIFGESLQEPFQPAALTVTREGKLLHPITTLKKLCSDNSNIETKGLVGAQVGLKLGFEFVSEELDSDGHFVMEWEGKKHVIPFVDE